MRVYCLSYNVIVAFSLEKNYILPKIKFTLMTEVKYYTTKYYNRAKQYTAYSR